MGFMSSGGSFPDLSGDGKITQKDILIGKGVINKKEGKRISKSDNKEYTKMLMALLEDKGRELTGMENMNEGGVVRMQSGQQPMNYMGGDVAGLGSLSLSSRSAINILVYSLLSLLDILLFLFFPIPAMRL